MNQILLEKYKTKLNEFKLEQSFTHNKTIPLDKYFFWKKYGKWNIFLRSPIDDTEIFSHVHHRLKTRPFSEEVSEDDFWKKINIFIDYMIKHKHGVIDSANGSLVNFRFWFKKSKRFVYAMVQKTNIPENGILVTKRNIAIKTVTDTDIVDTRDAKSVFDVSINLNESVDDIILNL